MNAEAAQLLTVDQARERLAVGRSVMYELMNDGSVRSILIGRSRRIPMDAIFEFIEAQMDEQAERGQQ